MEQISTYSKQKGYLITGKLVRHCELLSSKCPPSAHRPERSFAKLDDLQVGFYPFRGPDAPEPSEHLRSDGSRHSEWAASSVPFCDPHLARNTESDREIQERSRPGV
jgi:hypothetical protein